MYPTIYSAAKWAQMNRPNYFKETVTIYLLIQGGYWLKNNLI